VSEGKEGTKLGYKKEGVKIKRRGEENPRSKVYYAHAAGRLVIPLHVGYPITTPCNPVPYAFVT
jgi:hypothetical protein